MIIFRTFFASILAILLQAEAAVVYNIDPLTGFFSSSPLLSSRPSEKVFFFFYTIVNNCICYPANIVILEERWTCIRPTDVAVIMLEIAEVCV